MGHIVMRILISYEWVLVDKLSHIWQAPIWHSLHVKTIGFAADSDEECLTPILQVIMIFHTSDSTKLSIARKGFIGITQANP